MSKKPQSVDDKTRVGQPRVHAMLFTLNQLRALRAVPIRKEAAYRTRWYPGLQKRNPLDEPNKPGVVLERIPAHEMGEVVYTCRYCPRIMSGPGQVCEDCQKPRSA